MQLASVLIKDLVMQDLKVAPVLGLTEIKLNVEVLLHDVQIQVVPDWVQVRQFPVNVMKVVERHKFITLPFALTCLKEYPV